MKVLVITQYFWPEEFRINDICEGLVEKGYEVDVLTGIPNYPFGKFYNGYGCFKKYEKLYKGKVKINRVPIFPRGKGNLMLILNYISYMIMATLKVLTIKKGQYDRVFVFQLSPITLAVPGIVLSKMKKIRSVIYVQDLWPESLYSIINLKNIKIRKVMNKICSKIYKSFDTVLITSKNFKNILIEKGVEEGKIKYFPQWAEDIFSTVEGENKDVDKEGQFVITFAGNIGKAQSVETIIKAANEIKDNKNIIWNIIGDGSEFQNIKKMVNELKLSDTVRLVGRKPLSDMPKYYNKSDALLVTLGDDELLRSTLPAKVQSYMAVGKPILAAISGEGNEVINEANCGLVCSALDYKELGKSALILYRLDKKELYKLGLNGKMFFNNNFSRSTLLVRLDNIFKN